MNTPLSLQDRRVQYAILVMGVIAILVILFMFVLKGNPAPVGPTDRRGHSRGRARRTGHTRRRSRGNTAWPARRRAPEAPGAPGSMGRRGRRPVMDRRAAMALRAALGRRRRLAAKKAGPKPPHRGDPFRDLVKDVDAGNQEMFSRQTQEPSMADQLASYGVQKPQLYQTLQAHKQQQEYLENLRRNTWTSATRRCGWRG